MTALVTAATSASAPLRTVLPAAISEAHVAVETRVTHPDRLGLFCNKLQSFHTCGRKERPGQILWIMETWKHSRGGRSAEQVKFTTYLQLVGIQLHLLSNDIKTISLHTSFFYGRKSEGVQAHSSLALPGRVSESDSSISGHVGQSGSDSSCTAGSLQPLRCPHAPRRRPAVSPQPAAHTAERAA